MADARASLPLLQDIPQGCSLQKSDGGQRFTCVRLGDEVHVLDDRCPHQGYPLSQGKLREGTLTCSWHNWKFDVKTGACEFGGEGVRRYPSRVEQGRVVVDLSVDEQAERARLHASIERALGDGDGDAMLRDGLRLGGLEPGAEPRFGRVGAAFGQVAKLAARRVPYGFDHDLATLADLASWVERGWLEDAQALAVATSMFAQSQRYLAPREDPQPNEDWAGALEDLREERRGSALAKARGAARAGQLDALVREQLLPFLGDHLYSYGHGAIYTHKTRQLSAAFPEASEALAAALSLRLAWATAETSLPPWKATREAYAAVDALAEPSEPRRGELEDRAAYERAVLESEPAAVAATVDALAGGVAPRALVLASAHAAARRVARFDSKWERELDAEVTILDVSHALTFAEAALALLELAGAREARRLAVQAAAFVGKLRRGDRAEPLPPAPAELELAAAMATRDPAGVALGRGLERASRLAAYAQLAPFAASEVFVRPIFIAHAIKLSEAAYQLELADPEADHAYLEATLNLLLPRRPERSPARAATLAARVLEDGRPPRGLY